MAHIAVLKALPMRVSILQALDASTPLACMHDAGQRPTSGIYLIELHMKLGCFMGICPEVCKGYLRVCNSMH
jgi:hypothetical protein